MSNILTERGKLGMGAYKDKTMGRHRTKASTSQGERLPKISTLVLLNIQPPEW